MKPSFYESKIFYLLVALLIGVQFSAFFVQTYNHRRIAEDALQEELKVGERVVHQLLYDRNRQLLQTAEVLAKDYGFLQAFSTATQDLATIESVLDNHRQRARADVIMLSGLDHQLMVQSPPQLPLPQGAELRTMLGETDNTHQVQFSSFQIGEQGKRQNKLYHVIHSPLRAPTHMANLTVGYQIDQAFLNNLQEMTNLQLTVITNPNQAWVLNASTLPNMDVSTLLPLVTAGDSHRSQLVRFAQQDYWMLASRLSAPHAQGIYLVIAKPLASAMRPFKEIERLLAYLLVASLLISISAIFYVNKRFVMPLSQQAYSDNLTGLGNRRLFMARMENALDQLREQQIPFVLMMCDLNKFKQINDSHGHDVGDLVLKTVASRMKQAVRGSDTVVRLGGDEFALLLAQCDVATALGIADNLGHAISLPIPYANASLSVSTSIGLTLAKPQDSLDRLVKRADEAMYQAKTQQLLCVVK